MPSYPSGLSSPIEEHLAPAEWPDDIWLPSLFDISLSSPLPRDERAIGRAISLLTTRGVVVIAGPQHQGKTWFAYQVAGAIAKLWVDQEGGWADTQQPAVEYVDAEDLTFDHVRAVQTACEEKNKYPPDAGVAQVYIVDNCHLNEKLVKKIKWEPPGVVVLF